jgi:GDPmannose 4,6-dehydratase
MVKGQNNPRATRVQEQMPFVELVSGDLADLPSLVAALEISQPDEVYNLGAISFVALSFSQAELTANITGLGVLRMLEAIKMIGGTQNNPIRFYQASSSEMFGKVRETPQNELTPFHPRSPYGCAKVFGHDIVVNYRESYGLHASSGILFNHEGPRRGIEFVTRKVSNAAARIKLGLQHELVMGTLETKRDWGYAGDYVRAMWLMLQQDDPGDYVVATGKTHSIEEFVVKAFAEVGIENWQDYVRQDPKFFRPAEVDLLIGDARKARERLGWEPSVDFDELGEGDRRRPAEPVLRLRRVTDELLHLGGPHEARVLRDVLRPVVDADVGEREVEEVADGVGLAGGDDVVVGLVLLQHAPHRLDVVAGVAPVAARVDVAERQLVLQAVVDARHGPTDLARDELLAASRRLVVEEDARAGVQPVGLAVVDRDPVPVDLRDAVR